VNLERLSLLLSDMGGSGEQGPTAFLALLSLASRSSSADPFCRHR